MPTPESAYTPPSARPSTMYGFRNSQSTPNTEKATTLDIGYRGHPDQFRCLVFAFGLLLRVELELLLPLAGLRDRLVDRRDPEALVLQDDLAVVVGDRDVGVVRDVVREVPDVPRLAEDVGVDVLQAPNRVVVALSRDRALDLEERDGRELRVHVAHLAERLEGDLRRVRPVDLPPEVAVGRVLREVGELLVDEDLPVE